MNTALRVERGMLKRVHADLDRRHPYAAERVGFLACRTAQVEGGVMLLAHEYLPVADDNYEHDPSVGAMMNSDAIRKALQYAYNNDVAMLHVHRHEHRGVPRFSRVDMRESAKFVPDFWKVRPGKPHGILVLSHDAMAGLAWDPHSARPEPMSQYSVIGRPFSFFGRWWQ
jgi:proteasome lid subunit RPN8/RPN11